MKTKILSALMLLVFTSTLMVGCGNKSQDAQQTADSTATTTDTAVASVSGDASKVLSFLTAWNGKYSTDSDVNMFNNAVLSDRLSKMLGNEYDTLKAMWNVTVPIEATNTTFFTMGMKKHDANATRAAIYADIRGNYIYVGILENGKAKYFTEGEGQPIPAQLKQGLEEGADINSAK
jgi:hypothetical protein